MLARVGPVVKLYREPPQSIVNFVFMIWIVRRYQDMYVDCPTVARLWSNPKFDIRENHADVCTSAVRLELKHSTIIGDAHVIGYSEHMNLAPQALLGKGATLRQNYQQECCPGV